MIHYAQRSIFDQMTYRLRESFLAVRDDPPKAFDFVTLPPASIIEIAGEVQQSGLVVVLYNGQILAVFMRDIESGRVEGTAHA